MRGTWISPVGGCSPAEYRALRLQSRPRPTDRHETPRSEAACADLLRYAGTTRLSGAKTLRNFSNTLAGQLPPSPCTQFNLESLFPKVPSRSARLARPLRSRRLGIPDPRRESTELDCASRHDEVMATFLVQSRSETRSCSTRVAEATL